MFLGKFLERYLNFFHLFLNVLISFYNKYVFLRLSDVILLNTFYDFRPELEFFPSLITYSLKSEKWSCSSKMILTKSTLTLHRINKTVP
jgi:hypothetical protein